MKNLIVSITMLVTLGVSSSFAAGPGDDRTIKTLFAQQFAGAEHVKWARLEEGISKATFTLGGIRTEAYYSEEGELLGTLRNLFYSQLPLSVMQTLSNKFKDGVVIEIMEITNAGGTSYRVILEQKEKKVTARVNSIGEVTSLEKKKMKN
jgi:hypothetical protein